MNKQFNTFNKLSLQRIKDNATKFRNDLNQDSSYADLDEDDVALLEDLQIFNYSPEGKNISNKSYIDILNIDINHAAYGKSLNHKTLKILDKFIDELGKDLEQYK